MAPSFRHWTGVLRARFPCVRFPRSWALLRALLWLLVAVPLWCLGLVLLVLGLALSPWGSGLLLEEGAKRGFYELADAEGAPLDRLVLHDFAVEAGPASLRLQRLELAWADDCLLRGQLCIERLAVEGARLRLGAGEPEETVEAPAAEEPLEAIRLPFPVAVRALSLVDVDLRLADGTRIVFDDFSSGAEARESTVTLLPTRLRGLGIQLPLSAGRGSPSARPSMREPGLRPRRSMPPLPCSRRCRRWPPQSWRASPRCRWRSATASSSPRSSCRCTCGCRN